MFTIFYFFHTAAVIDTDSGFLAGTFTDYIDGARIYLEAPEVGQSNTERYNLGIQIRNMKMDFNIYGTWRRVKFEKLMMKIYEFFFILLSRLVALYNIV